MLILCLLLQMYRILSMMSFTARAKKLQLLAQLSRGLPNLVLADASRLQQVIVNLITNAIKFTPAGRVVIRVGTKPFAVAGSGAGPDDDVYDEYDAAGLEAFLRQARERRQSPDQPLPRVRSSTATSASEAAAAGAEYALFCCYCPLLVCNVCWCDGRTRVNISEHRSTVRLYFEVEDTGPGITDEQLSRLFKQFAPGISQSTRPHAGAGLGLFISNALVQKMGGSIDVRSRVGSGSAFLFSLEFPLCPAAEWSEISGGLLQTAPATLSLPVALSVLLVEVCCCVLSFFCLFSSCGG